LEQLRLRDEEARMLGCKNDAALSLAPKMAITTPYRHQGVELFLILSTKDLVTSGSARLPQLDLT
jgi:Zn-dependent oligopeptidase